MADCHANNALLNFVMIPIQQAYVGDATRARAKGQ